MYLELIRLKNIELETGCQQIADIAGDLFDFTKNVTEVIWTLIKNSKTSQRNGVQKMFKNGYI